MHAYMHVVATQHIAKKMLVPGCSQPFGFHAVTNACLTRGTFLKLHRHLRNGTGGGIIFIVYSLRPNLNARLGFKWAKYCSWQITILPLKSAAVVTGTMVIDAARE